MNTATLLLACALKITLPEGEIPFRQDAFAGPAWVVQEKQDSKTIIAPESESGITFSLTQTESEAGGAWLHATLTNTGTDEWTPFRASIRTGIDCWMTHYPQWHDRFVPTFLRSEPTHFYGYAQSPNGTLVGIASPDPIASWTILFNPGGHRIRTFDLDVLHALPLPAHHPQTLTSLKPGETRTWRIALSAFKSVEEWRAWSDRVTGARPIRNARTTLAHYETDLPQGLHSFSVTNAAGKISTGSQFVRPDWAWYLKEARKEALRIPPTETHHAECIYPFHAYYLARKHFPDPTLDAEAEAVFQTIFPKHYDREKGRLHTTYRIQDTAIWAGILADRYAVTRDEADLIEAARLCDYLLTTQLEDGAYYATHGKIRTYYTSVIYLAKSIMEVMAEEKKLIANPQWKARYDRHLASVTRAIANLAEKRDNIQTEGEQTFEDGMISCSIAQLAMFALKTGDAALADQCLKSAEALYLAHQCLTITETPDARVNGSTIRYWETQYTICLMANLYNSPCGWTAWKLYADNYLYLLTGNERYLTEYFNGLGACVQLLDLNTKKLRWGFTPSPYIYAKYAAKNPDPKAEKEFIWKFGVFGETYLDPISDWNKKTPIWRKKWGIDNFTHEIFKCMEEGALTTAYLHERDDGTLIAWNGTAEEKNGTITFTPRESTIARLHIRLAKPRTVNALGSRKEFSAGMHWIGDLPPDLKPF